MDEEEKWNAVVAFVGEGPDGGVAAVTQLLAVCSMGELMEALNTAALGRTKQMAHLLAATGLILSPPHGADYLFDAEVLPYIVGGERTQGVLFACHCGPHLCL